MLETNRISLQEASNTSIQALTCHAVSEENARIQTELWIEAELRGRPSHGLLRLPRIVERLQNGVADPLSSGSSHWRGTALLDVDGERGLGPVVAFAALALLSERAKSTGVAVGVVRNSNHLGMLALYAERVAAQGQVLIALSTSEALVHPWGGRVAMVGTNPIAIGVPASPRPFVLDMATSAVSMGQIHDFANQGRPLKAGWALDGDGEPTTDAHAAKSGAIAPFGDAKGYALGLAFEVLVASLTASALGTEVRGTLDSEHICNKGDVFIVLEPASSGMAGQVTAYLDAIRACAPSDPHYPVVVPGDRAHQQRTQTLQDGIAIAPDVWARIRQLAGLTPNHL